MKYVAYALGTIVLLLAVTTVLVIGWAWQTVEWYPPVTEVTPSCVRPVAPWQDVADATTGKAPVPLKVMSFNVQYMAGKNYVFFTTWRAARTHALHWPMSKSRWIGSRKLLRLRTPMW